MTESSTQTATVWPLSRHARLIAASLPDWLKQASPAQLQRYRMSLERSLAANTKAQAILRRIEAPDLFCEARLIRESGLRLNRFLEVRLCELITVHHLFDPNPNLVIRQQTQVTRQNLLAASMANFTVEQARARGLGVGSAILPAGAYQARDGVPVSASYDPRQRIAIEPSDWAALCREVDLGASYQLHIQQTLRPLAVGASPVDADQRLLTDSLMAVLREEMDVQAQVAVLRGNLDDHASQMIHAVLQPAATMPQWQGHDVLVSTLRGLVTWARDGTALSGIVVLEQKGVSPSPCVVYLPSEPDHPLKLYSSFSNFTTALREKLRDERYRHYFRRFLGEADQALFFHRLEQTLSPLPLFSSVPVVDADADIGLRLDLVPSAPVRLLYDHLLARIVGDGQAWVVATAEVDRRAAQAQQAKNLANGLNLLNAAALFVPGLDLLALGVAAGQLLRETFLGVDDWTHGQTQEALGHLFSVGENLALIGINAGAGALVSRSGFVERMVPTVDATGQPRLWSREAGSDADTADVDGLMRRLGPPFNEIDVSTLGQVRLIHDIALADLRRLHDDRLSVPAAWLQSVRSSGHAMLQPLEPLAAPVLRDFPGLSTEAANAIASGANTRERGQLRTSAKVPLRLAEQASVALRDARIDRALAGLIWPSADSADAELLRAGLRHNAGTDAGTDAASTFARAVGDRALCARLLGQRHRWEGWFAPVRQPDGRLGYALSGRGAALGDPILERLSVLYPSLPRVQLEELRDDLGADPLPALEMLEQRTVQLRDALDLWQQTPATYRNAEGATVAVEPGDRQAVSDRIMSAWRLEAPTASSLLGLHQVPLLDLSEWRVGALPSLGLSLDHVGGLVLDDMALSDDPSPFLESFPGLESLDMTGNQLTTVPEALGQMQSLVHLRLGNNRLLSSPDLFSPLFDLPHLRRLSLSGNRLQLPSLAWNMLGALDSLTELHLNDMDLQVSAGAFDQLARLPSLEVLSLTGNQINMTASANAALGRLDGLIVLLLSRNPLGSDFGLRGLSSLQSLALNDCALTAWPEGLSDMMNRSPQALMGADLRNNPITEVPVLADFASFNNASLYPPLLISRQGLTPQSLERLAAAGIESESGPVDLNWQAGAPARVVEAVAELRETAASQYFVQALDRAPEMASFQRQPSNGRERLWALVEALTVPAAGDDGIGLSDLREQVFSIGEEVMTTCGDGIQLLLQRCENLVLAYQVSAGAGDAAQTHGALLNLSRQLLRAALLDETAVAITQRRMDRRAALFPTAQARGVTEGEIIALTPQQLDSAPALHSLDDIDSYGLMRGPDEADFTLMLRMRLQTPLGLLTQPRSMLYEQPASATLLERLATAVNAQDTPARQLDWLVEQPWWCSFLQRYRAQSWQALSDEWNQGFLYIFEQGRSEPEAVALAAPVRAALTDLADSPSLLDRRLTVAEQELLRQRLQAAWMRVQRQWIREETEASLGEQA